MQNDEYLVGIKIFVFQVTLRRATEQVNKSKYVTERQVHKVVYLLALGVQEQETDPEHCQFVTRAAEAGLVEQLARLAQDIGNSLVPDHVRRLAAWVVKQCTAARRGGTATQPDTDMKTDAEVTETKTRKRTAEIMAGSRDIINAKVFFKCCKCDKQFRYKSELVCHVIDLHEWYCTLCRSTKNSELGTSIKSVDNSGSAFLTSLAKNKKD